MAECRRQCDSVRAIQSSKPRLIADARVTSNDYSIFSNILRCEELEKSFARLYVHTAGLSLR